MSSQPPNSPKKTFFSNLSNDIKQKTLRLVKKKLQNYDFSQQRTQDEKINVMQLDRDRRFKTEQMIIENATKNFPFFTKLIRKGYHRQVTECYKVITPLSFKKGECVFYQGDIADHFYILLRGKVTIITQKDQETIDKERSLLSYDEQHSIQNYITQLQSEKDHKRAEIQALKTNQPSSLFNSPLSPQSTKARYNLAKMDMNIIRKASLSSIGESNSPLSQSFSEYSPKKQTNKITKILRQQTKSKFQSRQGSTIINTQENQEESPEKNTLESNSKFSFKFLFDKAEELLQEINQKQKDQQGVEKEINLFGKNRNINQDDSLSPVSNYSMDSPKKHGRKISYFQAADYSHEEQHNKKDNYHKQRLIVPELPGNLLIEDIAHPIKLFQSGVYIYSNANTIKEGESFGEGGLILRRPRTATVICNQDCDFAVISRQDYDLILKEVQNKKINKKIVMLVQNLDKNIPFQTASRLCFAFFKIQLSYNQPVFSQGEHPSYVYFLKKGEIEIILNERVQSSKKKRFDQLVEHVGEDEKAANEMKIFGTYKFKNRTLSSISDGQFFGEEDVLSNANGRSYTARVRSSIATIFRIKASEFRFILSQSSSVKEFFTNRMDQRQAWRQNQQKKVGSTVEYLHQPERKQRTTVDIQDSNQIVSGIEDIDKIIRFCQEKQIISPTRKRDVGEENFSSYVKTQIKTEEQRNKAHTESQKEKDLNQSNQIPLTLAQKRQQYLSSKRPQSASEIYTTSNFIMTANKNNKQYVKERGGELYSNENPTEQNLFHDDYKEKVKYRLEKFQKQQMKRKKQGGSPSPTQTQGQRIQSQTSINGYQSEEFSSKVKMDSQRRSLQEQFRKHFEQTPTMVKSLVSIQEFNINKNEEDEETSPIKPVQQQQQLHKNMSAPLIKDDQYILNLSMIPNQLQEQQVSLVFSPSASPRIIEDLQRPSTTTEPRQSSFQINLQQSNSLNIQNLPRQQQNSEIYINNDVSPRIILKDNFQYQTTKNISSERFNFQKRIKIQEQLRKSSRKYRNQHLQNLINIQDTLINSTSQLNAFKNSYGINIPSTATTLSSNKVQNIHINSHQELKSSFDLTNPLSSSTGLNNFSSKSAAKSMFKYCVNTPKTQNESQTTYSVPMTFQASTMAQIAQEIPNRLFKHSSLHSFQQTVNENSLGLTPSSNNNNNNTPSKITKSQNFNLEEKRYIASQQIDFIKKFKMNQQEMLNKRAQSAQVQKITLPNQISTSNNQKTEQNNSEQISTPRVNSSSSYNPMKKILSPNQGRPKTAIGNSIQAKSMTNLDLKNVIKSTPKVKTQRPQTVISQVYMSPESLSEFQTKSKVEQFKHQFSDNVNGFFIDSQMSQFDINSYTIDHERIGNDQITTCQTHKPSIMKKYDIQSVYSQQLFNQKKFSYSMQKAFNNTNLTEDQTQQQLKSMGQLNQMEQEIKSPNIINIVFPLRQKVNKGLEKKSHHKKQHSLNLQPPQKFQSSENLNNKKESINIFSTNMQNSMNSEQKSQITSLNKQNANLLQQIYRIPEAKQILTNKNKLNY